MEIKRTGIAGTMESSDAMVTIEKGGSGIELSLTSPVIHRFGNHIRGVVLETLEALEIQDAVVTVVDKGALDCTLKARVEGAAFRAAECSEENIPWGGAVK
ncbi:MAG: citrate lyase acyl carrier protein [Butyricicoccus sp.]|nr:citrate lyase acyl carrier protein [Butyricicoccus sp.]